MEAKVGGLKRLRISSIEASQISDEVIEVLDRIEVVVRHLHIPFTVRTRILYENVCAVSIRWNFSKSV